MNTNTHPPDDPQHMTPEAIMQVVFDICDLYAQGQHTLGACCIERGYTEKDFLRWLDNDKKPFPLKRYFKQSKYAADQTYLSQLRIEARKALLASVNSTEIEEIKEKHVLPTGYTLDAEGQVLDPEGNPVREPPYVLIERHVTKKTVPPNASLVKLALLNADPDNFKERKEDKARVKQLVLDFGERKK